MNVSSQTVQNVTATMRRPRMKKNTGLVFSSGGLKSLEFIGAKDSLVRMGNSPKNGADYRFCYFARQPEKGQRLEWKDVSGKYSK